MYSLNCFARFSSSLAFSSRSRCSRSIFSLAFALDNDKDGGGNSGFLFTESGDDVGGGGGVMIMDDGGGGVGGLGYLENGEDEDEDDNDHSACRQDGLDELDRCIGPSINGFEFADGLNRFDRCAFSSIGE